MNITMKRQNIIDKLNELMPAFKAEDKRLLDIYNAEMAEYSTELQKRVKELARMKRVDLLEFIRCNDVDRYIKGTFKYKNHNRLYDSFYSNDYRQPFLATKYSYVLRAEEYLKHLELASTRSFTLSQDGRHSELYKLVTFEPYTETA